MVRFTEINSRISTTGLKYFLKKECQVFFSHCPYRYRPEWLAYRWTWYYTIILFIFPIKRIATAVLFLSLFQLDAERSCTSQHTTAWLSSDHEKTYNFNAVRQNSNHYHNYKWYIVFIPTSLNDIWFGKKWQTFKHSFVLIIKWFKIISGQS